MKSPSVHLFFPVASSEALGDVCILKQSKTKQTKKTILEIFLLSKGNLALKSCHPLFFWTFIQKVDGSQVLPSALCYT